MVGPASLPARLALGAALAILATLAVAAGAQATTVGLDGFGYAARDSVDASACADLDYDWIELFGSTPAPAFISVAPNAWGTSLFGLGVLTPPFDFNYYGMTPASVRINANGLLSFTGSPVDPTAPVPAGFDPVAAPNNVVAGYWTNLLGTETIDAGTPASLASDFIAWKIVGTAPNRIAVAEFNQMRHDSIGSPEVTFQIQLHETVDIVEVHYKTITGDTDGDSVLMGIEGAAAGQELAWQETIDFPPTGIMDGTAIRYYVNTVPAASSFAFSLLEDDPGTSFDASVTDAECDSLAYTWSGPSDGSIGSFPADTYTPNADFFGTDQIAFDVFDAFGSSSGTVDFTVDPVNDAPDWANGGDISITEDAGPLAYPGWAIPIVMGPANEASQSIQGYVVQVDPADVPLFATLPAVDASGELTFEVAANAFGTVPVNVSLQDDGGVANGGVDTSPPQAFNIIVAAMTDPPVGVSDAYSVNEDATLTVAAASGVLANDYSPDTGDNSVLDAILFSSPGNGVLTSFDTGTGAFTYEPADDFFGTDGFSYRADDGSLSSPLVVVTITVNPVNDDPVAIDDSFAVVQGVATNLNVLANDGSDPDGPETLSVVWTGALSPAAITATPNGADVTFQSPAAFNGVATFTYRIEDSGSPALDDTATVTVFVNCASLMADADGYLGTEDAALAVAAPGVLDGDTAPPGASIVVAAPPSHGSVTLLADGSFTYLPAANYNGPDAFTYKLDDGSCVTYNKVTLGVAPANDNPKAVPDSITVFEESAPTTIMVLANDADAPDSGETLSVSAVASPVNGFSAVGGGGAFVTYAPKADFFGTDVFPYTLSDGNGGTAIGIVTVTVVNLNDAPVAEDDVFVVRPGRDNVIESGGVLDNDEDVDGDVLSAALVQMPVHGALSLKAGGGFTYTPQPNYSGPDHFVYAANDGSSVSNAAVVQLEVVSNVPPVSSFAAAKDTVAAGFQLEFTDSSYDPDGEVRAWSWSFGDGQGSSARNPSHAWLAAGLYTVRLTVVDNDGLVARVEMPITVTEGVNNEQGGDYNGTIPLADAGPDQRVQPGEEVVLDGSGGDADGAIRFEWRQVGSPAVVLLESNTAHPYFIAPGLADGQPVELVFSLAIFDGHYKSALDLVTVRVGTASAAEDPVAVAGPDQVVSEGALVTLRGTAIGFDPAAQLTYRWFQVAGPDVGIGAATGQAATFAAPPASEGTLLIFRLTVTDGVLETQPDSVEVVVTPASESVGFRYEKGNLRQAGLVAFTPLVEAASYRWDFGDGSNDTAVDPIHAYSRSGSYTVRLTATEADGDSRTYEGKLRVYVPSAPARADKDAPGVGLPLVGLALLSLAGAALRRPR